MYKLQIASPSGVACLQGRRQECQKTSNFDAFSTHCSSCRWLFLGTGVSNAALGFSWSLRKMLTVTYLYCLPEDTNPSSCIGDWQMKR